MITGLLWASTCSANYACRLEEASPVWLYQRPRAGCWAHRAAPVWAQRLLVGLPLRGATGLVSISSVGRRIKFEREACGVCTDPRSSRQEMKILLSDIHGCESQAHANLSLTFGFMFQGKY